MSLLNQEEDILLASYLERIIRDLGYTTEEITYLGGEAWGQAFKVEDKVIKITADEKEYINASRLRKRYAKHLVNYYDAREIIIPPDKIKNYYKHYYVLVMDLVTPVPESLQFLYQLLINFEHAKKSYTATEFASYSLKLERYKKQHNLNREFALHLR
jgi:hypothetical protein